MTAPAGRPCARTRPAAWACRHASVTAPGAGASIVEPADPPAMDTANPAASGARILVVDDQEDNVRLLADLLSCHDYRVETASGGQEALDSVDRSAPDLILLDVAMPGLSGLQVLRRLRADTRFALLPIVLVTALDPDVERIKGLEAGADDFVTKPINSAELLARVRSLVRVKYLFDRVEAQADELEATEQRSRAARRRQGRGSRASVQAEALSAAQVAARVSGDGLEALLASHRAEIAVVFFDLRGFTAFSERSEPEDVMRVLSEFHHAIGTQSQRFAGTIERFVGDGAMIFFNDPEPVADPCAQAARFALAVFEACRTPLERWRREEFELHIGSGLAYGYATSARSGSAIATTTASSARSPTWLRAVRRSPGREIIVSARAAAALPASFHTEPVGR